MKTRSRVALAALLFSAAILVPAFASGSYTGVKPPKPKSDAGMEMKLDQEKYGLGQKIYEGRVELMAHGDAESQMGRLKMLQAHLPTETGMKKDLVGLAGKLTSPQLDALEYYVDHRFAMKK